MLALGKHLQPSLLLLENDWNKLCNLATLSAPLWPIFIFCNLRMGPISQSVCHWQTFPGKCIAALHLVGPIRKVQRKGSVVLAYVVGIISIEKKSFIVFFAKFNDS